MTLIYRSLLLALLACLSMGLFAKSLPFSKEQDWIDEVFLVVTFALAIGGVWLGVQGARQQRKLRAWLAPGLNGFLIGVFLVYLWLYFQALARIN
ncbi:MAG: hypothetical protein ABIQ93_04140 [Saprospiraceae bacterium]